MSSLRPELPEDESLFGSPVPKPSPKLSNDKSLFGSPIPESILGLPEYESLFGSPVPESTLELPEHESFPKPPAPKPSLILPQCNKTAPEESVPELPTPELTPVVRGGIKTGQPNRGKLKENVVSDVEKALALQRITATPTVKFEDLSPEKQKLVVSQLKRFIKEEQERRDKKRQEIKQSNDDAYVAYQKAKRNRAKLRAEAKRRTATKTNGPLSGSQPLIPGQLNMPQDPIVPRAAIDNNEDRGAVGAFGWFEGLERMY
ncbi:hypothetical protein NXS19_011513 [Fusarium pseudograminearum]|uniref:Uncharacterized protein n=1 Tax=Fusarium pseudograminearum (strain CS3096) TaxID=1028729 RepID=K3UZB6_FUSPC|nr:hypothetical protein FPSE_01652 [Fusarium pseudograminearum CS3096]EKJ78191.1 hypothetical protein FPSE_01652 [Fusarium pseudograminearum CS3096]UZP43701.1 hypothetical protein NXS19_011513 [Fusarium pseudograminearum]